MKNKHLHHFLYVCGWFEDTPDGSMRSLHATAIPKPFNQNRNVRITVRYKKTKEQNGGPV